jgi:SAM-dependent methyltransferase
MFHHSFEHLADPESVLKHAVRLLKPGGRLLIRLPVGGCLAWQRYGTDWVNLDAPRHLSLFSPLSMQILSERCGLAIAWQHFEGSAASFVSSDLYAKDVPLIDHAARARGGLGTFGLWKAARKYRALAEESNRNGQGDCACFELRLRTEACTPLTAVAITYCAGTGRPRQTALR